MSNNNDRPRVKKNDLIDNMYDPDLRDAWGIVIFHKYIYVAAKRSNLLIRYDLSGLNPFDIGFFDEKGQQINDVGPTAVICNPGRDYIVTNDTDTYSSSLIIASASGDIFGYNECVGDGSRAYKLYYGSTIEPTFPYLRPLYTGLTLIDKYLYVTDFLNGKIDVFCPGDTGSVKLINFITKYGTVAPNHASPFNIVFLKNALFVIYAYKSNADDRSPNGLGGFIDLHDDDGTFVKRFNDMNSDLKAPYALIDCPKALCQKRYSILVGDFTTGQINVYNKYGVRTGELHDCKNQFMVINGLWGLDEYHNKIYFAAGPNNENDGLVGSLEPCNSCHKKKFK